MKNIPDVKLGMIAVSRDCFIVSLSRNRRKAFASQIRAKGIEIYESDIVVENEKDALKAVDDVSNAGCNALIVFLGNFDPETPETLIAKHFDGPVMYVAAAEETGEGRLDHKARPDGSRGPETV